MKKFVLLIVIAALSGCGPTPPSEICTDYRMMLFYDNGPPPIINGYWSAAKEHVVCVVREQKIGIPK